MEWQISDSLVAYETAVAAMEERVAAIRDGTAPDLVWLLEHPPLYTAGTSADPADLLDPGRLPVYQTGRGGQYTWHGPGQRIAYVMLDLKPRGSDVRQFVGDLEEFLIRTLASFNIKGERRSGRVGIWVAERDGTENKIAAIGVRVRRWVTFHGVALNVDPDLSNFAGIVPCGISQHGVTSLARQGILVAMPEVDAAMKRAFRAVFGSSSPAAPQLVSR
jgi:lipoyl(octanoyl) transferase